MLDMVLAIAAGSVVVALSVLSAPISANKRWHIVAIYMLGFLALVLIGIQAYRNQALQSSNLAAQSEHQAAQSVLQSDVRALREQIKGLASSLGTQSRGIAAVPQTEQKARIESPPAKTEQKPEPPKSQAELAKKLPPPVAHTRFTTHQTLGTDSNPYAVQVIIQTDLAIENPEFTIRCIGEIYDARFFVAGEPVVKDARTSLSVDRSKFIFSFSHPPFSPESPIVVTLFSKSPIKVVRVDRTPRTPQEIHEALKELGH